MDAIALITGQRAGAGHLLALCRNIAEIALVDDICADGIDNIATRLERAENEARAANQRILLFKVTSMVPRDTVERDILGRTGTRAMLLVRRQIDTYVSLAKATALDTWQDFDTTPIKAKLEIAGFAQWMDDEAEWYAHWRGWLLRRALPAPILRYETAIELAPEIALRWFAQTAAQLGIVLKVPPTLSHSGLTRQDRNRVAAEKIRNWSEFSKGLVAAGIERRAFGYPI